MGSPAQVPHFSPNEMSLIRARVCRANLPVCFLIRGLDSFAFAREESALRCLSSPPSRILQGFWVLYEGPSSSILQVPRFIGVGSEERPLSIPRVLTRLPFQDPRRGLLRVQRWGLVPIGPS